MSLQEGESIMISPTVLGFRTLIRRRHSHHQGHTPGLEQLFSHNRHMQPLSLVLNRSFVGKQPTPTSSSALPENRMYGYQGGRATSTFHGLPEQIGYPYYQNQNKGETQDSEASYGNDEGLHTSVPGSTTHGTTFACPQRRLTPKQ